LEILLKSDGVDCQLGVMEGKKMLGLRSCLKYSKDPSNEYVRLFIPLSSVDEILFQLTSRRKEEKGGTI